MPTPYSWTLVGGPLPETPAVGGEAVTAPLLPGPIVSLTQQDLLDLWERILPQHWLAPIKDPGPGYEMLQAYARLMSRASISVATEARDSYITSAMGGAKATGSVELYRGSPNSDGLIVVVKAGTVVTSGRSGRDFKTLTDVTFQVSDLGPFTVAIEAVAQGYEWNVPGVVIAADGTPLSGDIDTIKTLVEDPGLGDLTIQVRQLVATAGGQDAALDQLGSDRGVERSVSEQDADYRNRVRALPDTVSPDAIARAVKLALQPVHVIDYTIIETWDVTYQTCYDAPSDPIPGSNYDPACFVYDDPDVDATPFRNRFMDENEERGCCIVVVPNIQPMLQTGMVYDDTAMTSADLISSHTGGRRAVGAYDVPSTLAFGYVQGCFDGDDYQKNSVYKGLYTSLQNIKAAGATVILELKGQ